jgi:hypothetical protein
MCTLIEQSLILEVDFNHRKLKCLSKYSLKITHPFPNYTLLFSALQIQIKNIKMDSKSEKLKIKNSSYPDSKKQSQFLSKLLDEPLNFENYMTVFNYLEKGKVNSANENERISITLENDENFNETEVIITIEYILQNPVAGLRFLFFQRDEKIERYLYSHCYHGSAKYWVPILSDLLNKEVFFGKLKIIVPSNYHAISSGKLEERIEIEEEEKMAFIYSIGNFLSDVHLKYLFIYCFARKENQN